MTTKTLRIYLYSPTIGNIINNSVVEASVLKY